MSAISNVKNYIIRLGVDSFNRQTGLSHIVTDFDCFSIVHTDPERCMFEIFTRKRFDNLRLRLSCRFGNSSRVDKYGLVVAVPTIISGLGDEVWYANAEIDPKLLYSNSKMARKTCPLIFADPNVVLIAENGQGILTEDGDEILLSS